MSPPRLGDTYIGSIVVVCVIPHEHDNTFGISPSSLNHILVLIP